MKALDDQWVLIFADITESTVGKTEERVLIDTGDSPRFHIIFLKIPNQRRALKEKAEKDFLADKG